MKKILLIPAILALSTNFAFAIGFNQQAKINQSVGNTSKGGFARNRAFCRAGDGGPPPNLL